MAIIKKLWNNIEGLNGLLFILYSILVFFMAIIVSDHFSLYYSLWMILLIIVLSIIFCPIIIRFFSQKNIKTQLDAKNTHHTILRMAVYVAPFAVLLLYYVAYFPGGFSPDSLSQYGQAISNQYKDWHPVIQTLFTFKLPLSITGGWIGSIILFQILCFSIILGYSFDTVLKYTNTKYTVIAMIFVLMNPQLGYISMYPWKDISFAMGALLMMVYSLRIFLSKGEWIKKPWNMVLFILTASLTTLFRHNALLFTIPLIIAILFYLSKKRGFIICLSILVLCLSIKLPLYYAIGVQNPNKRQVELLGLPMTVIGAVVTYTPEALDKETLEFAYKVAPKEVWESKFTFGSYNTVKWNDRTNNDIIEEYGTQKVLLMMFKCFKVSKGVALKSLIRLTEASFSVTSDYDGFFYPYIDENSYGLSQSPNDLAAVICEVYRDFINNYLSYPFLHLGILHLVLIGAILSKCKFNSLKDWKKIFFVIPVFAYNFGTSILLTGVEDASRFFFYTYPTIPILLVFLFKNENEKAKQF